MEPQTSTANTNDWIEVSKRINLAPYIESYMPTLSIHEKPISSQNFYEALRNVSTPFQKSTPPLIEPQFRQELQAWDTLSDEALIIFEQKLG